jgi:Domain of unknown function (DUF4437)
MEEEPMLVNSKRIVAGVLMLGVLSVSAALAVDGSKPASKAAAKAPDHAAFTPADMQWGDAPPFLMAGAKLAVLQGDPTKAQAYTVRLRVPDGFKIMPHWHPTTENVTVISGTFHLGTGDTFDDTKGMALGAGSFGFVGPKMHHYAWFTGESEVQINGVGPLMVHYVHAADDPRLAKK